MTPPFNFTTSSDGAVVGVLCGVVLMVVTSTGLRSTGGSLHCFAWDWMFADYHKMGFLVILGDLHLDPYIPF